MGRYDNETLYATPPEATKPSGGNRYDNAALYPPAPPARPQAEMRAADLSPSQRFKYAVQDALMGLGAKPHVAQHLAEGGTGVLGMTPMGSVLSAADLPYNASQGNYVNTALDALGVVPGVTAARRIVGGMPRIRPAEVPPPWVARGSAEDRGFVTPSTPELIGYPQAATPGRPAVGLLPAAPAAPGVPAGAAIAGYGRIRNSPIQFDPLTGRDYQANVLAHLESPAGGSFSPATAPAVYNTIEHHAALWENNGRPVPASYVDNLRSQLRNMPAGPDAAAGQRAARYLDQNYLANPTPGAVLPHNPADFATLQADLAQARGNYRAGMTAQLVENAIDRAGTRNAVTHSAGNLDNKTRQNLEALAAPRARGGIDPLFAASPTERQAVLDASQPSWLGGQLRGWSKYLGGGGGLGQLQATGWAGAAGSGLGHLAGLDPVTTGALAGGTALGAMKVGAALGSASDRVAVKAAEDVADQIRRASPEYAARVAATPDMVDPRTMTRDAITYAMLPQVRQQGEDIWQGAYSPYEQQ